MSKKKEDEIVLESFKVERRRWGDDSGSYRCSASYSTENFNFTINIGPELGELLLHVCRGKVAEHSAKATRALTILAATEKSDEKV